MALLPVSAVVDELLAALQSAAQVMLHAPTGAGKSTWLPLEILRSGGLPGRVVMLEPRRLAAKNVALRLAEQLGERPGQTVGYRMRNESRCGPATRLEVVTEGILTRQLQQDPALDGVSLVILDEFHERSLQADLALALLLDVQRGLRDDLKVLIMSATLDDRRLSQLLPQAPVIRSAGRSFPVERRYQALPAQTRTEEAIAGAVQQLLRQQAGSLLLFLPGVAEINRVQGLLGERLAEEVMLCPLYGALPLEAQQRAGPSHYPAHQPGVHGAARGPGRTAVPGRVPASVQPGSGRARAGASCAGNHLRRFDPLLAGAVAVGRQRKRAAFLAGCAAGAGVGGRGGHSGGAGGA